MNVAIILPTKNRGGAEGVLYQMAKLFTRQGWSVDLFFLSGKGASFWDEIDCSGQFGGLFESHRIGFLVSPLLFIQQRIRGKCYDLVVSSHTHCNALVGVMRLLRLLSVKKSVYRESTNVFERFNGVKKLAFSILYRLYGTPELIVCQTQKMRDDLLRNAGNLRELNISVIENPVDFSRIQDLARNTCERISVGSEIVHVGRFIHEKGLDLLIRAFAIARKQHCSLVLRLIGQGPTEAQLVSLVKELGLVDAVIFHGFDPNPFPYVYAARVAVVSSRHEGFPNVLLEMMCVSSCVVSTDCAEGVANLPGIEVCMAGSESELARAILAALSLTELVREDRVKLMRAHVSKRTPEAYLGSVMESLERAG